MFCCGTTKTCCPTPAQKTVRRGITQTNTGEHYQHHTPLSRCYVFSSATRYFAAVNDACTGAGNRGQLGCIHAFHTHTGRRKERKEIYVIGCNLKQRQTSVVTSCLDICVTNQTSTLKFQATLVPGSTGKMLTSLSPFLMSTVSLDAGSPARRDGGTMPPGQILVHHQHRHNPQQTGRCPAHNTTHFPRHSAS
jgi:hypothetical protein